MGRPCGIELKDELATHAVKYSFYLKNRITDRQTLIIQTWTLGKFLLRKELNETVTLRQTGIFGMIKNGAFNKELGSFPHLKTYEIHGILTNMACG